MSNIDEQFEAARKAAPKCKYCNEGQLVMCPHYWDDLCGCVFSHWCDEKKLAMFADIANELRRLRGKQEVANSDNQVKE